MLVNVDFNSANFLLEKYRGKIKEIPGIDPFYILIDAKRDASLKSTFFTCDNGEDFFYHAFHESKIPGTNFYDIQSPYGYGGPVSTTNNVDFLRCAWELYQSYCQDNNIIAEFIRFHPLLENWKYYLGDVLDNRETVWIDLTVEDLLSSYKENRVRTAVRKAMKNNVQVSFYQPQEFLPLFKKLYYESMIRLKTDAFYFFNDDYLYELCSYENAWLAVATHEGNVLATLISLVKGNILELHLFGSSLESNKLCATNLIYHETFLRAKKMGFKTIHFGGGTGNNEADPLFFFKLGYSDKKANYKIGKFIHNEKVYAEFKHNYEKETGNIPERILFYR